MTLLRPILACLLALSTAAVSAQITSPVPETAFAPEFPGLHDREALVELEFTVGSDGQPRDFRAVGGFHEQRFVDATIAAVNNVSFRPATANGSAVDWPQFRITARFVIEDLFNTIQPGFSNDIRRIEDHINAGEYAQAETLAVDVLNNQARYFFEFAYINTRLSEIYLLQGKLFEAALASDNATLSYVQGEHDNYGIESAKLMDAYNVQSVSQFSSGDIYNDIDVSANVLNDNTFTRPVQSQRPPHIRSGLRYSNQGNDLGDKPTMDVLNARLVQDALQAAMQIHARLGHVVAASNDAQRFATVNPRQPDIMVSITELLDRSQEQGMPIQSQHRIDSGEAVFFPARRAFTVANVEGDISAVDFRCDRRVIRLAYQAGNEWQIPTSWGDCALRFLGSEGATFAVIEFE
jgi:hypothetical protein